MEFDEKETEKTLVRYVLLILLDIDHSSDIFKDHLSREYCEENVMFWRETNKFKKLAKDGSDDKAARKLALAIVSQFIVSKGSTPINISDLTRAKIQARLEDKAVHANMFQEAVSEIEQLMAQGPFPRFTRKLQTAITSSWKLTTDKLSVNEFGKILYMNWFMLCPDIMPFFKGDLVKHGNMLVGMVEAAVGLLDDLKKLIPKLVTLGKRHVKYGARAELFESLGKALVQTMQESLESEWTSEMAVAWHTVFKMMSCVLIHSMQRHAEEESVSGKSGTSDRSRLSHVLVKSGLPLLLELDFRSSVMKDQLVYFYKKEHLLFWREVYDYQDLAVDGNKHKELLHSAKPSTLRGMHRLPSNYQTRSGTISKHTWTRAKSLRISLTRPGTR